ncbi:Fibrinogen-like protein A [Apostichopus japonicus]|uniref:Fibrinogen-like protein A n=1 Tax=Stichopus japonicus TaxID=307972 RepID=A0A2G8K2V1_STIJA|nr:Fibrinogen-like protein A [Apostichopus japonicus]
MCLQASYAQESSYFVFQQPDYQRDCKEVLNACSSTHHTSGVYLIKPDGYPEPFEVFCDNDLDTGGWTILHRRSVGSVKFNRTWTDFQNGFGFLGSEFWIGNEKIAFLTNQKQYQLRIEFQNVAGEAYYVTYDNFRISDEWGQFSIASLGTYEGTAELEKCVCVGDYMVQDENCIPQNQCSCFVTEKGGVFTDGEIYVSSDCTSRSVCSNNQLIVEESYQCSDHATCGVRDGVRRCYCIDGYEGNGVNCTREAVPKDCQELYVDGSSDGV